MRYIRYIEPKKKYYEQPKNKGQDSIYRIEKPKDWEMKSDDHWTFYFKPYTKMPIQGWKIHISSTSKCAQKTLDLVSDFLFKKSVPFKHVLNAWELMYKNSKYGHRGSSGKFITVYPLNDKQFLILLKELHQLTRELPKGPYILSDKRWFDGNVYFRYGAFGEMYITEGAAKIPAIQTPNNEYIPDSREAHYVIPYFVKEPDEIQEMTKSQETTDSETSEIDLYDISSALHFSNGGGVYLAKHLTTNEEVVLKEGRPSSGLDGQGRDAVERLNQEELILNRLKGLKHVVQLKGSFKAWEHSFLVEEYIEGTPLTSWLAAYYPFSQNQDSEQYAINVIHILKQVKKAVEEIHSRGIGMGDLQPANIMVTESNEVKLIDFEAASDLSDSKHSGLMTLGFPGDTDLTRVQADWFAFLRIARYVFLPIGPIQDIAEDILVKHDQWIAYMFGDQATSLIKEIEAECIKRNARPMKSIISAPPKTLRKDDIPDLIHKIRGGMMEDLEEARILLKGDIRQHEFPYGDLNVLTGGFGVILALSRTGKLPHIASSWAQQFSKDEYLKDMESGLFIGKAGIAGVLYEIGEVRKAREIYNSIPETLETEDISLVSGLAGIGLALLSASIVIDSNYMTKVYNIANRLEILLEKDITVRTRDVDAIPIGLLDGWSGVSLFFSVLYKVTNDKHWLSLSLATIQKDIDKCVLEDSGLYQVKDDARFVPYLAGGSAGIGLAMMMIRKIQNSSVWENELQSIALLTKSKCFYSPGLFRGLSGFIVLGNAMDSEFGDKKSTYLEHTIQTLNLYLLQDGDHYYLPGDYCYRLSGDLFSGASGLLLALADAGTRNWFSWLPIPHVNKILCETNGAVPTL